LSGKVQKNIEKEQREKKKGTEEMKGGSGQ